MSQLQTVYVVDDDQGVRESLRQLLEVCGFQYRLFDSAESFLTQFRTDLSGCLILDIRLPEMDGLELLESLAGQQSSIPVIMLSAHGDIRAAVKSLKLGAVDFIQKPFQPRKLLDCIHNALQIDAENRRQILVRRNVEERVDSLTNREKEILELIVEGEQTKAIAHRLGTSQNTVSNQRTSIMKKMQAETIADLVRMVVSFRVPSV